MPSHEEMITYRPFKAFLKEKYSKCFVGMLDKLAADSVKTLWGEFDDARKNYKLFNIAVEEISGKGTGHQVTARDMPHALRKLADHLEEQGQMPYSPYYKDTLEEAKENRKGYNPI
jgi:hypothetical protein